MIVHPVVAYFTSTPMSSCELCKVSCASLFGRMVGGEEGDLRRFAWISGALAFDYGKATACRQFGFKWFEGVDLYRSLVEAPVRGVGFLCVGKRGEACSAVRLAALNAWRFSFLSWKK